MENSGVKPIGLGSYIHACLGRILKFTRASPFILGHLCLNLDFQLPSNKAFVIICQCAPLDFAFVVFRPTACTNNLKIISSRDFEEETKQFVRSKFSNYQLDFLCVCQQDKPQSVAESVLYSLHFCYMLMHNYNIYELCAKPQTTNSLINELTYKFYLKDN